jgi:hypothetical protein
MLTRQAMLCAVVVLFAALVGLAEEMFQETLATIVVASVNFWLGVVLLSVAAMQVALLGAQAVLPEVEQGVQLLRLLEVNAVAESLHGFVVVSEAPRAMLRVGQERAGSAVPADNRR